MPTAINRLTKQVLESQDPTVIDLEQWICPVDLGLVSHLPPWRWVVDGDLVRAPTTEEAAVQDSQRLAEAKSAAIAAIDARTPVLLSSGVRVNGESISCSLPAQQNLMALAVGRLTGRTKYPLGISTTTGGQHTVLDATELDRLSDLVWNRVDDVLAKGRALRVRVLAATSIAEVEAVEDDRE